MDPLCHPKNDSVYFNPKKLILDSHPCFTFVIFLASQVTTRIVFVSQASKAIVSVRLFDALPCCSQYFPSWCVRAEGNPHTPPKLSFPSTERLTGLSFGLERVAHQVGENCGKWDPHHAKL